MTETISKKIYSGIDIGKFVMALFVIALHAKLYLCFSNTNLSLGFQNLFNICVPYFFICSGYLIFNAHADIKQKSKKACFKFLKLYAVWFIVYLPLTIYGEIFWKTGLLKSAVKIFRNFLLVGVNFYSWQLWYLLAAGVAFLLIYLLAKANIKPQTIFALSAVLYFIGIIISFINEHAENFPDIINRLTSYYFSVFTTVRNGFFFGFFYISFGMILSLSKKSINRVGIFVAFIVGILGCFAKEKAIFSITEPLLSVSVFLIFLNLPVKSDIKTNYLRHIATISYYIHMYVLFVYRVAFTDLSSDIYNFAICFLITTVISITISGIIIAVSRKKQGKITLTLFGRLQ